MSADTLANVLDMRAFVLKSLADAVISGVVEKHHFAETVGILQAVHELQGMSTHSPCETVEFHILKEILETSGPLHFTLKELSGSSFDDAPLDTLTEKYSRLQSQIKAFNDNPFMKGNHALASPGHPRRIVDCVLKEIAAGDATTTSLKNIATLRLNKDSCTRAPNSPGSTPKT